MEELILLSLNSIRADLKLGVFYKQYYRIFMHLKARMMVTLYCKCDFQRMKPDTGFQTTCELFSLSCVGRCGRWKLFGASN